MTEKGDPNQDLGPRQDVRPDKPGARIGYALRPIGFFLVPVVGMVVFPVLYQAWLRSVFALGALMLMSVPFWPAMISLLVDPVDRWGKVTTFSFYNEVVVKASSLLMMFPLTLMLTYLMGIIGWYGYSQVTRGLMGLNVVDYETAFMVIFCVLAFVGSVKLSDWLLFEHRPNDDKDDDSNPQEPKEVLQDQKETAG